MLVLLPERTVLVEVFGIEVHWYAVMYLVAFGTGWVFLPKLLKYRELNLSKEQRFSLLTWIMAGVLIGGRLGYVVLYEPIYFMNNLWQIFYLSNGGMSSHGGFIGVGIAVWFFVGKEKLIFLKLVDVLVVLAALGLAIGRIGNFVNQELYVTQSAVTVVVAINLVIAGICWWWMRNQVRSGSVTALFLILYAVGRFISEYFREPEWELIGIFTRGQVYSLVVLLVGLMVVYFAISRRTLPPSGWQQTS